MLSRFEKLLIILFALVCLDLITTCIALQFFPHKLYETNIYAATLFAQTGLLFTTSLFLLVSAGTLSIMQYLYTFKTKHPILKVILMGVVIIAILVRTYTVLSNIYYLWGAVWW